MRAARPPPHPSPRIGLSMPLIELRATWLRRIGRVYVRKSSNASQIGASPIRPSEGVAAATAVLLCLSG